MKKIYLKKDLFVMIMLAVLLTGCRNDVQTEDTTVQDMSMSSDEETQVVDDKPEEDDKSEELLSPCFAEITLLDTEPELDGNVLLYGNLQITLPEGVTVEQQESDEDAVVIDLIGAESVRSEEGYGKSGPLPPRIWLANYHVEYDDSIMEVISTMLDLLPDVSICERYTSGKERCYLYTYDKPYKKGYILIYEDDVYIVEEISFESDYSFGGLLDERSVQWKSRVCAFDNRKSYSTQLYSKFSAESDMTFLVMQTAIEDKMRVLILYQDGYFSSVYQNIAYEEWRQEPEFKDCNFDGCSDIVVSDIRRDKRIYLWDAEQKEYETVQIPEDFSECSRYTAYFPETKTIWKGDINFNYADDAEGKNYCYGVDYTEILWKWENSVLVKQRECTAEVRDEDVRISAYEGTSSNVLFEETVTKEEWEQNSIKVQKLYQQFYAEMVPEGNDGYLHIIDYDQESKEYIPQALLDTVTKAMLDGTELETLKELVHDQELTKDEILALAKDNLAIRCDVVLAEQSGDYIMVMSDADNDGITDIVAEEYFGGSGGFTEYVFYKGQDDGTYQKTSSYDAVKEEFAVITYDGKNYLCRTLYDYTKKIYNGISIACYVDGVQVQTAELMLYPEKYDITLAECTEERYRAFAENIFENSHYFKEEIDEYKNIDGSSEEKSSSDEQYEYRCDLDNDGDVEQYHKTIWLPSNMGTSECLHFYGDGEGIEHTNDALYTTEGRPIMMWVEPFAGKNIVNVISLTGLHDFEITGFLINGAEYTNIYRITAEVTYDVNIEVYTQMHWVNI